MIKLNVVLSSICSALLVFSLASTVFADEVVIDDSTDLEVQQLGDYQVSTYPASLSPRCQLKTNSDTVTEITAGELWSYFDAQGLSSVNKLVICLDADEVPKGETLGLDLFEVRFEDSTKAFTLGDNSLILTADSTNALRPECQLEIQLDYDFMQRYSKNSTEKIQLNFGVNGKASLGLAPSFSVGQRPSLLTLPNLTLLGSFCVFWVVVFLLLKKFTLNEQPAPPQIANPQIANQASGLVTKA